jgi:hypothetical protein
VYQVLLATQAVVPKKVVVKAVAVVLLDMPVLVVIPVLRHQIIQQALVALVEVDRLVAPVAVAVAVVLDYTDKAPVVLLVQQDLITGAAVEVDLEVFLAFVDQLVAAVVEHMAVVVAARFPVPAVVPVVV